MRVVRQLFMAILSQILLVGSVRAADISIENGSKLNVIHISGRISADDDNKFLGILPSTSQPTVVSLRSNGGNVVASLNIAEIIKSAQFDTVVPRNSVCASACGLIWLAGATRFYTPTSSIGFHAAFRKEGETLMESGKANALIGAFLTRLGLSYRVVAYATDAAPSDMAWLTKSEAARLGIEAVLLPESEPSAPTMVPSVPLTEPPQIRAPAAPVPLARPSPSVEQTVAGWIQDYYTFWSKSGRSIAGLDAFYSLTVNFYGGDVPKSKILAEKAKFVERWPVRSFAIKPGTLSVACDRASSECTARGVVEWDVSSQDRLERSVGAANFIITVTAGGKLAIKSETGSIISRRIEPLKPAPDALPKTDAAPDIIALEKLGARGYNQMAETGMSLMQQTIQACYDSAGASVANLQTCIAFDAFVFSVDHQFSISMGKPNLSVTPFFAKSAVDQRIELYGLVAFNGWSKAATTEFLITATTAVATGWRRRMEALSQKPDTAAAVQSAPPSQSSAWTDGRQARATMEQWLTSLSEGPYKSGVQFWAENRSKKVAPACSGSADMEWVAGCKEAQLRFRPIDARRLSEKDFKAGWNSF